MYLYEFLRILVFKSVIVFTLGLYYRKYSQERIAEFSLVSSYSPICIFFPFWAEKNFMFAFLGQKKNEELSELSAFIT